MYEHVHRHDQSFRYEKKRVKEYEVYNSKHAGCQRTSWYKKKKKVNKGTPDRIINTHPPHSFVISSKGVYYN